MASVADYELHNILCRRSKLDWCEWHLKIDKNDKAIEIAKKFHQDSEKLKLSSSIVGKIDTIEETFLEFMPKDTNWNKIRNSFKQAREKNSPLLALHAYTVAQGFSSYINKHSAANTNHTLERYCTLLNCPILARTQAYTEAFTSILFHPKLEKLLVRKKTVYRGSVIKNKELVANYKEGATIITTTFLSTSPESGVAEMFSDVPAGDMTSISIFCTYNISNSRRRTALDLSTISKFREEVEILILRYVPFTVKSVERMDDGRRMTICLDECEEE